MSAVTALCLFVFAFQGSRGLWEPDEGRYANVAMEMLRLHDVVSPRLSDDVGHYTKPPLAYWAIAGSVAIFGRNEWAVRFPHAVAFVLTVVVVYRLGRHLVPARPWLPALIYATSLLPYLASNCVTTDTLLALWEALAVLGFGSFWFGSEFSGRRRGLLVMWLGFGLAFLTKGPPGLLPLLAILTFVGIDSGLGGLRRLFPVAGLALFLLSGATWYVVVLLQEPGLLRYFLVEEVFERVATGMHHRNPQWYGVFSIYLPTLLLGTLPWTGVIVRSFPSWVRFLRQVRRPDLRHANSLELFLILWVLLPLGVFLAARSKLPLYVLPLFVPISLLLARRLMAGSTAMVLRRPVFAGWILLLLGLKWAASVYPGAVSDSRGFADSIREQAPFAPREIVFVESKPCYGLSLYLDAEVETASLGKPQQLRAGIGPKRELLNGELAEEEPQRLFLVPAGILTEFKHEAAVAGQRVKEDGGHRNLRLVHVEGR